MKTKIIQLIVLSAILLISSTNKVCSAPDKKKPIKVLMVGGGSSHDFDRWYKQEDVETLQRDGLAVVSYTDDPSKILGLLPEMDVLFLANNQPISDEPTRAAIFTFSQKGKGIVLAHPALWYNWKDWPGYNQLLVGGGSRGHDAYGPFRVKITNPQHPVTKGLPADFKLDDELYYFKSDTQGSSVTVLATAQARTDGPEFPSIFTVGYKKGKIVGIALGHDAASHKLESYQTLIRNAVNWVAKK
ncbi:ThuA domain-containing protein [Dyadobacter tibetensis]|uniref:ThuA domain-containing protein n=1 Tax=Dyadobacter tibetensis TaxID=1211851 RepID=UPI0004707927|nr:ThuA domain-containing protein [Dyadobacter tibetensis]